MLEKTLSYIPATAGLLSTGFFVLLNNSRDIKNRLFFLANISAALWLMCLFIADTAKVYSVSLWFFRFALFFGQIIFLTFFLFSIVFPYPSNVGRFTKISLSVPMLFLSFVLLTNLGVQSITVGEFGVQPLQVSGVYVLSDIVGIIYLLVASAILLSKYRKSNTRQRSQIRFVLYGLSFAIIVNIFTGIVLTALEIDSQYLSLGGFSLFIFSLIVGYSMIKHKLFDIKFIVVRSLGYLLSLGLILLITSFVIFGFSNWLISQGISQQIRLWVYIVLTLVFSISFQPIKKCFDSLTSKLFYRDAYETQTLLNEFNEVIVSTIDLSQLLTRAGVTIQKYLKPETIAFALRDTKNDTIRIIADKDLHMSKEALEQIRAYVHKSAERLIITDVLEDAQKELKQLLKEANIGVLARITTNVDVEGNGYIVMGYKKSGNMYNSQDIAAIEIVANELAIAIQNALQYEEIQKFNVTLQEQIEQATKKMQKTNEKLRAMDETKDEFISMASHQLRTPLTSVKGYLSMVIEGDAGELNEMQHKLLDQAFVSSQRMVYLIADLLNVSRLRTGKFIIEAAPTNLADVIQGEVEQLVETAGSRGLTLKYDKPENFPTLMLDETKVRQVIMNFIDNAIYYTPTGGNITVNLKDLGQSVEYTVVDDGIGVPKSEQYHMFSKFYRAENAKKARPDGTGLGLFMAKKVIVAQGGSIVFKSAEGKGSTFGFTFAKDKLAAVANNEK